MQKQVKFQFSTLFFLELRFSASKARPAHSSPQHMMVQFSRESVRSFLKYSKRKKKIQILFYFLFFQKIEFSFFLQINSILTPRILAISLHFNNVMEQSDCYGHNLGPSLYGSIISCNLVGTDQISAKLSHYPQLLIK